MKHLINAIRKLEVVTTTKENKWKSMPVDRFRNLHSQNLVIPESVEDAEAIILRCMPFAKKEGLYGRTIQFMNEYISDRQV